VGDHHDDEFDQREEREESDNRNSIHCEPGDEQSVKRKYGGIE
jgi:hypothetical protein